jgi:hypothetical protein
MGYGKHAFSAFYILFSSGMHYHSENKGVFICPMRTIGWDAMGCIRFT